MLILEGRLLLQQVPRFRELHPYSNYSLGRLGMPMPWYKVQGCKALLKAPFEL